MSDKLQPIHHPAPAIGGLSGYQPPTPFSFDAPVKPFFALYLKNIVLTLLTLGIYRFWATVEVRKFLYQHTSFADGRFDYHATGKERFVAFVKGMLILMGPIVVVCAALALIWQMAMAEALVIAFYVFFLVITCLRPLIIVGARAFNLSRTSWNNMRFRFVGKVGKLYAIYIKGVLLTIVTFGIYAAWLMVDVERFKARNSYLGNTQFDYRGEGGELFGINFLGAFLSYITLGIYIPWYIAKLRRYHVENTWFQNQAFRSSLTGGQMFVFMLKSVLAVVLTLGLALPWVIISYNRMMIETTEFSGQVDVNAIRGTTDAAASATLEGLGTAGDALEAVGDLFG